MSRTTIIIIVAAVLVIAVLYFTMSGKASPGKGFKPPKSQ